MKIGNIEMKNGVFLAPMAGVTDAPFRLICAEYGAECVITEMVSAKAVCYGDKKTASLATLAFDRRPAGIQIFGSEPAFMADAAARLMEFNPDFIDINMGCPVRKVTSCGEGSALMRDPTLCGEIVSAVVKAVPVPVTVKMRAGYDAAHINAPEVAKRCEEAGASAITVHGRTREMMYSGKADRSVIAAVSAAVSVPVIGNGDICSAADATSMLAETGCAGIMAGRGTYGRPWLFAEIRAALEGRDYIPPTVEEQARTVRRHIALQQSCRESLLDSCGCADNLLVLRRQIAWYVRGRRNSADARRRLNSAASAGEFLSIVDEMFAE